jgi:2'-5' RNA ligase
VTILSDEASLSRLSPRQPHARWGSSGHDHEEALGRSARRGRSHTPCRYSSPQPAGRGDGVEVRPGGRSTWSTSASGRRALAGEERPGRGRSAGPAGMQAISPSVGPATGPGRGHESPVVAGCVGRGRAGTVAPSLPPRRRRSAGADRGTSASSGSRTRTARERHGSGRSVRACRAAASGSCSWSRARRAHEMDGLRRAVGADVGRVAPHVTLVPPVNVREDELGEALGVVREAAAASTGPLTLGPGAGRDVPAGQPGRLPRRGRGPGLPTVHRLQEALRAGPLARKLTHGFVPHVTIADELAEDRIPEAMRALGELPPRDRTMPSPPRAGGAPGRRRASGSGHRSLGLQSARAVGRRPGRLELVDRGPRPGAGRRRRPR